MSFKDLLVHVDNTPQSSVRLAVAAALAAKFEAHLVGLYVVTQPHIPGYVRAQIGEEVLQQQRETALRVMGQAEQAFRQAVERLGGGSYEWRQAEGDLVAQIALHARYADLAIIGQNDPDNDYYGDLPDRLPLTAGRPVLVVPFVGRFETVGERVVVAWNAGREATRAVNDALPILRRAKKVTVLVVNPKGGLSGHGDVPGADIALHLARHGVKAEAEHVFAEDIDVGNLLLSRLADEGADLLVTGAYGRSRLRELALGGVTRHLLQHMTVPVLMSH